MTAPRRIRKGPDTQWRIPFKDWTMADLLIANFLRDTPLTLPEVSLFLKHKVSSLQQTLSVLRAEGRLTPDNKVLTDHPAFTILKGTPKTQPLPPPGSRPKTRLAAANAAVVQDAVARPLSTLTREQAASILANIITTGEAGDKVDRYIATWLETAPVGTSGPPAPLTPTEATARLLTLLSGTDEAVVRLAISQWESHLADLPPNREAPMGHGPDGSRETPDALPAPGLGPS